MTCWLVETLQAHSFVVAESREVFTPDVFDSLTGQSATFDIMNSMELFGAMPPAEETDRRAGDFGSVRA